MAESSRVRTTAQALGLALEALGDALAQVRPESMLESAALIDERVQEFRAAVADAKASGHAAAPEQTRALAEALARCRRLGHSLTLLTGSTPESPQGYTPVGRPLPSADGGAFLTARG